MVYFDLSVSLLISLDCAKNLTSLPKPSRISTYVSVDFKQLDLL
jgi:hypothetical protein